MLLVIVRLIYIHSCVYRGALDVPNHLVPKVFEALRHFHEIMNRPSNAIEVKLKAGDLVAFNNRRVLHGRRAFDPSTG